MIRWYVSQGSSMPLTLKAKNHTEKGVVFAVVQFIDSLMQALKACFLLP